MTAAGYTMQDHRFVVLTNSNGQTSTSMILNYDIIWLLCSIYKCTVKTDLLFDQFN